MFKFILKRIGVVIPTFVGITLLTFALIRLIPGDPVELMAGERGVDPVRHAKLLAEMGLDQPLFVQYWRYLTGIFQGDLGHSVVTHQPVIKEFFALFPATLELGFCAIVIAILLGLPAGIIAAVRRGKVTDYTVMGLSLTGYSMPIFWWGLLLILFFSVNLGWTPVSGRISATFWVDEVTGFMLIDAFLSTEKGALLSALHHLILPSIVLATIPLAVIARMTRSAMLEILREDYVLVARAKGLTMPFVVCVHALRNALIPVITVIGLQVGVLMAGAILTETIFSWPGIGKWLLDSIYRRDYPSVQGGILMVSCMVILVNLVVDICYGVVNPRIRHNR
jgi:dipeptide transport system permease protein